MGAEPPLEMFSGEYVGHLVDDALLLLADPLGGENGSADEDLPGVCLVADLDALGVADEHDGVVADDVASPDRMDADLLASGTYSLASVDELLSAHLLADDLSDGHGGSAGSVLLLVVVGLDDLHVVVVAEEACGLLAELHEGGDTDGVVGTDDRGDVVLDDLAGDHGLVLGGEAGSTDDEVDTAPGCDGCVDDGGLGDGEVDVPMPATSPMSSPTLTRSKAAATVIPSVDMMRLTSMVPILPHAPTIAALISAIIIGMRLERAYI